LFDDLFDDGTTTATTVALVAALTSPSRVAPFIPPPPPALSPYEYEAIRYDVKIVYKL